WSLPVLVVAGITTLLGVLYALMEHDLKRLLAYHTVENIGIIFIGLGLALAFEASGLKAAAALSLTAAIFHVFNHSLFKSLLFLGSGAVLHATGERDMERLGGLIHRMPVTALAFLAGCIAISALPPFNGFVSEWLTFQAILLSPQLPQWVPRLIVPAVGATLACAAALAATSCVGLRLSGCESRHAVHRRQLRAAHPARIRRRRVSRPRARHHARTGRYRTGASRGRAARHALGGALRAGDPPRRCGDRPSEPV